MRRVVVLWIVLFFTTISFAAAFFLGFGFNGLVEVNVGSQKWSVGIVPVTSLSSGGIIAGQLIFNVLRDRGFAVIPVLQPDIYRVIDTFHCEAVDVNIERLEVFVADGTHGIEVFKFYGSSFYKHIQTIPLKGWINSVVYMHDYLLAGSELDGLFVIRRGESGFELMDQISPRYVNDLEEGVTVNAIAAWGGSFYVAAGERGVMVFEIDDSALIKKPEIKVVYAMDVSVSNGDLIVADSREEEILVFDTDDLSLKERHAVNGKLREVMPVVDWQNHRNLLVCLFNDSVAVIDRNTSQEIFSLEGSFFGLVEPRYFLDHPFLDE
ncbi:MAG: hypothetical protein JW697_05355 [Kosmotogaceae bacterium]|nr:hypothetical protein [Kosmotogaceae bacterium]